MKKLRSVVMLATKAQDNYKHIEGMLVKCIKEQPNIGENPYPVGMLTISKNSNEGVLEYWEPQYLYFVAPSIEEDKENGEEIKEGDWGYSSFSRDIFQYFKSETTKHNQLFKIIATTDPALWNKTHKRCPNCSGVGCEQCSNTGERYDSNGVPKIPLDFVEVFFKEQGKIDKVNVEYELETYQAVEDGRFKTFHKSNSYRPKLNNNGSVKIFKVEPEFFPEEKEAIKRFQNGEQWSVSTFIDEDSITAGYGKFDENQLGEFQYPLPSVYIKQIYGTTSWKEQHKEERRKAKLFSPIEEILQYMAKNQYNKTNPVLYNYISSFIKNQ